MSRSLTRAWAPVPLKGQSSRIAPRFASTLRATSFTGIGSVLVSITIVPRLADAPSSAATSARAYAEGSEVMTISVQRTTSRGLLAATPPARACSARRRGTTSKPVTRNPERMRFADIAEPMIPSPIIPTVCCFIAPSFSVDPSANTLPFSLKKGGGVAGPVSNLLVGVDIGGTFTDCVVLGPGGDITATKAPSTPGNFAEGMLAAMQVAAERLGFSFEKFCGEIAVLTHGTTVGTNALIQRKGAKVGLITTQGHEDAIHIMRGSRGVSSRDIAKVVHFPSSQKPVPIVPKRLIEGVSERVDCFGEVVVPLNESEAETAIKRLVEAGAEAIGVCFLWSFKYPRHEQRVKEMIRKISPGLFVSCSTDIAPKWGEYERVTATALNAYLGPGVWRDRLALPRAPDGLSEHHHHRHGRNLFRCRNHLRRAACLLVRFQRRAVRIFPAQGRHPGDRLRRRFARTRRSGREDPRGGAGVRGRRSRAGVLRQGRHDRDRDGRGRGPRHHKSGQLPWRAHQARQEEGGGIGAAHRLGARPFAHGGSERHRQDRRVQDGRHHPQDDRGERFRPARLRAVRFRRRGPGACGSVRARARRAESHRAAEGDRFDLVRLRRRVGRHFARVRTGRYPGEPVRCGAGERLARDPGEKGERADGPRRNRAGAPRLRIFPRHAPQGPDQRGRGDAAGEAREELALGTAAPALLRALRTALRERLVLRRGAPGDRDAAVARHRRNAAAEA